MLRKAHATPADPQAALRKTYSWSRQVTWPKPARCLFPRRPRALPMTLPVKNLRWARYSSTPPQFKTRQRPRGRKALGVKYERAGHAHFAGLFSVYSPGPWIHFLDDSGARWCQPDAVASRSDGGIVILEFKYSHTRDAWMQLRTLYEPLIAHLHPGSEISVLEVCKWYDPLEAFPETVRLVQDPMQHRGNDFGVHIWRP